MKRILVCDDDRDILKSVEILLKSAGYEVLTAENGRQALEKTVASSPSLLILDVMMPEMDGLTALMKLREKNSIPVIMLSAKGEIEDKVLGLNAGADDYLTKPFSSFELLARVNSQLRRAELTESKKNELFSGGIRMDDEARTVTVDGKKVYLTPNEYGILKYMLINKGKVMTSDQIYSTVWNEEAFDVKKIISLHISNIRDKIEINPKEPDYLISIYGMGYKLEDRP